MNLQEKLEIVKQLEKLKIDVVEAGFAIASSGDFKSVEAIAKMVRTSVVASLSRALQKDIDAAYEDVKKATFPRIHTFLACT